jgi:formylglycine-generating enzyme required for sulfatase activity
MLKKTILFIVSVSFVCCAGTSITKSNKSDMEMIAVEGGSFTMGCTDDQGEDCGDISKPAHKVTVNSFKICKYEVTQKQWCDIMGGTMQDWFYTARMRTDRKAMEIITTTNHVFDWELELDGIASKGVGDNYPMYNISYDDIQKFIRLLNEKTGKKYRLPTEAEWEFAARGGNKSSRYKYSGSNNVEDVVWYLDNCSDNTHEVGTKRPNELGLYDMSGNVWELCSDGYSEYRPDEQINPAMPSGTVFSARGGAWHSREFACRISFRGYFSQQTICNYMGFRLAE